MGDETGKVIVGEIGFNNCPGKFNSEISFRNAPAELVVVGKVVGQSFESANRFQVSFAQGKGRSETKTKSTFDLHSSQNPWHKVCADAQRFESRTKRARWNSAVRTRNQTDARPLQFCRNGAQIA